MVLERHRFRPASRETEMMMRSFALATALVVASLMSPVAARANALLQCKNDACYKAVSANANAPASQRQPGCASFLGVTVTPRAVTKTETTYTTTTTTPASPPPRTVTVTTVPSVTQSTTVTDTETEASTVLETVTSSTTTVETQQTAVTVTRTTARTTAVPRTVTVTSTSTIPNKRAITVVGCPTTSASPSTLPAYASACSSTAAYSSACACYGGIGVTVTLGVCTTTTTATLTRTATAPTPPAGTVTAVVTEPTTVRVTATATATETTPTTVATTVPATETQRTTETATATDVVTNVQTTVRGTTTATATATAGPYGCIVNGGIVYQVDLPTGNQTVLAGRAAVGGASNAMGLNRLDDALYAVRRNPQNGTNTIVRIVPDGTAVDVALLPGAEYTAADIDGDGFYWVTIAPNWYQVDLRPGAGATYGTVLAAGTYAPPDMRFYDWVFLPSRPGYLWALGHTENYRTARLARWSMTDHTWEMVVADYPGTAASRARLWHANVPVDDAADPAIYAATFGGPTGGGDELWRFTFAGQATRIGNLTATATTGDGARCPVGAPRS